MTVTTRKEGRREAGLDDLPSEWSIVPSGMIIQRHRVIVGDRWSDYERLSLTLGGVVPRTDVSQGTGEPDSLSTYQVLPAGALVFKLIDLENVRTSRVGLSGREGIVSSAYIVADVNENVANARFMYWFFMALYLRKYFNYMGNGGVRSALNFDDLARIPVPLPPLAEQESIANYLDRETAEIDSMIGDLDSFLFLLADRRRTLITDAVQGKTGPGAGEGFQQIPLHQLVTVNDDSLPETCSPEFSFDYVDISSVSNHEISSNLERYSFLDAPSRARRLARQGDVVLSTVRTYLKAIAPVTQEHERHVFSTGFAVLRPHQQTCDSSYLRHVLFTDDFINEVVGRSNGVSYPAINSSELLQIRVNVPSVPVQRQIADYLDWETGQIDLLIEDARCTRELLVERREALISDAVTGKLNITSWN